MKRREFPLAVWAAAFLAVVCSGFGQGLPGPTEPLTQSTALQLLHSDQKAERNRAVKWLADQRQEIIAEAMKTLAGPYSDDVRMAAARTLGEYRASEAVSLLMANLEMERHVPHSGPIGMSELYAGEQEMRSRDFPLTVALERIGEAAIPALIGRIKTADDVETELTCMTVCWRVEGPDVTQFRLQKEMEAERDVNTKGRIQLALQMMDDIRARRSLERYRMPPGTGITNLDLSIKAACALALTNIRSDLAGLSEKFPVLAGVASAQIMDHGFSPRFVLDLAYLKNSHAPPATNATNSAIIQRRQFDTETRVLDPGGVDLEVVVQDALAKFPDAGVPAFLWLSDANGHTRGGGYMVSYHLRLKEPNPDLDKAVKAVMDKQTGILKTNLLSLLGAGAAP